MRCTNSYNVVGSAIENVGRQLQHSVNARGVVVGWPDLDLEFRQASSGSQKICWARPNRITRICQKFRCDAVKEQCGVCPREEVSREIGDNGSIGVHIYIVEIDFAGLWRRISPKLRKQ